MKNQVENKNRNKFDSHMFVHLITDLIGPLYIFCILMSNVLYITYMLYIIYIIFGVTSTLVSPFACNTRVIVDVRSKPLVSHVKLL